MRTYKGGRAEHLGVATDYTWLCDTFTRLAEATGDSAWLHEARSCAYDLITIFSADDGGFYLSGTGQGRRFPCGRGTPSTVWCPVRRWRRER